MRISHFVFLLFVLTIASCENAPPPAALQKPLDLYVSGLREGRLELLRQAFLPNGRFCWKAAADSVICEPFSTVLPTWTTPDPLCEGHVLSWEATEEMARVTFELEYDGLRFKDHLLLYKPGTDWVIVSKSTEVMAR